MTRGTVGTSKRKVEAQHHETERYMWFELLQTMNTTLEVIRNDQVSTTQRVGQLEREMRSTMETVLSRLQRLESSVNRQHQFNAMQHGYNDRIDTVLEILSPANDKNTSSKNEFRVVKEEVCGDGDGSGHAKKDRRTTNLTHAPEGVLITPNPNFRQIPPTINLDGDDFEFEDVDLAVEYDPSLIYMDGWAPPKPKTLSANQASPSAGSGYDPFGPIPKDLFQSVRELLTREGGLLIGEYNPSSEFFGQLLLDKPRWEGDRNGWLTDEHMCRAMDLFRKRSLVKPSPYKSERIAFLDPMLCALWCNQRLEYENNPRTELITFYLKMFTGETPAYCATNKVWYRDVDILYVAHFIAGSHWIALEINLLQHTIYVYDAAKFPLPDQHVINSVRAYETLITALVKIMGPKKKPIVVKKFGVIVSKRTPANIKGGDCGIYTLKCIECLALGMPFTGLEDRNTLFIRRKYAVDILTEVIQGSTRHAALPNPMIGYESKTASPQLVLDW